MGCHSLDVQSLFCVKFQACLYKLFALIGDCTFGRIRENYWICFEHNAFTKYSLLAHLISKGFLSVKHLKVDDSDWPNINFWRYQGFLFDYETLWGQIPISADSLRSEFYYFLICCFAQSEISYLYFSFME